MIVTTRGEFVFSVQKMRYVFHLSFVVVLYISFVDVVNGYVRVGDDLEVLGPAWSGGWPMKDVRAGRNDVRDYKGDYTYFFAMDPGLDHYVSGAMLGSKGGWEPELTRLFDELVAQNSDALDMPILDFGANFGAFSLHAASKGFQVWAFEMQPVVFTILELSRRVNSYHRMHLFHAALWNESGVGVTFTPELGNFGGTSLIHQGQGQITMTTERADKYFTHTGPVFFMKIGVHTLST